VQEASEAGTDVLPMAVMRDAGRVDDHTTDNANNLSFKQQSSYIEAAQESKGNMDL